MKDEQPAYAKAFGLSAKGVQEQDSWKTSLAKAGSLGRSSVKMILMRPHVKSVNPERAKLAPLGKSPETRRCSDD
jgi:hypothetical protein